MDISVDLHSHSGASGGVGVIRLDKVVATMRLKGIAVFGTGDCLHDGWMTFLEHNLVPAEQGLFRLPDDDSGARFLLQTEIILTAPVSSGGRKNVHLVFLFPSFACAKAVASHLDTWGVKRTIGRPFLTCEDAADVAEKILTILDQDPGIEAIPAHVMTPQGIFGSNNPIDKIADFFGEASSRIGVVETGLSADPQILALIPELDSRTLISNSDCHSEALNRIGREYTTIRVSNLSYDNIIAALRNGDVMSTAEFTPAEGRYFLTGHRGGKNGHAANEYCYFSPDCLPTDNRCPICGKPLTIGVLQRALELSAIQGANRTLDTITPNQAFRQMIPLVEVIAAAFGVKSVSSKKILTKYTRIVEATGSEVAFWNLTAEDAVRVCERLNEPEMAHAVHCIVTGNYAFDPLGYDGEYGVLTLDNQAAWFGQRVVVSDRDTQTRLL